MGQLYSSPSIVNNTRSSGARDNNYNDTTRKPLLRDADNSGLVRGGDPVGHADRPGCCLHHWISSVIGWSEAGRSVQGLGTAGESCRCERGVAVGSDNRNWRTF